MNRLRHFLVVTVVASVLGPSALSQCPSGVATLRGKVENLPSGATNVTVTVVLKTPKGEFPQSATVADGQFTADVRFSTLRSWSPLWGHHCSNLPKSVALKVSEADKTLAEEVLDFKKSFEQQDANTNRYRLKRDLTIDVSKSSKGSKSRGAGE